jgi:hypothetical protein
VAGGAALAPGAVPMGAAPIAGEAGAAPRVAELWGAPGHSPAAAPWPDGPGFAAPGAAGPDDALSPAWPPQDAGGEAQAGAETAMQGVIEVDGAALGRFVAEHLAREAGRPQAGMTGFDPRQTPPWGGAIQG